LHKSPLNLPVRLDTERLNIRKYAEGDGRELYLLLERYNNRELLKTNVEEVSSIKTETEAEMRFRKRSAEWIARDRFVMGIWLKSQSMYVGEIWIEPEKWEVPSFEIGWFLDQGYQGRGIATEALRHSLEFLFNNIKAHKVIVITRDTNSKSYRLA